jgi:hypothetical protein
MELIIQGRQKYKDAFVFAAYTYVSIREAARAYHEVI